MTAHQDKEMEKEILELGLTAPRVSQEQIESLMAQLEYKTHIVDGTNTTMAIALFNGFSVATGQTACVDPENFNEELGRKYAIQNAENAARDKLWELEGWRLKMSMLDEQSIEETRQKSVVFDSAIHALINNTYYTAWLAHEVNRAYCSAHGDDTQVQFDHAPDWQTDSAMNGVAAHLENPDMTPEQSHESWMAQKEAEGWVYGEVKDPDAKTHPCMVPYAELPLEQRVKDHLFKAVVGTVSDIMASIEAGQAATELVSKDAA